MKSQEVAYEEISEKMAGGYQVLDFHPCVPHIPDGFTRKYNVHHSDDIHKFKVLVYNN